jgi:transcriptional regulator with XRE-family HTH domain
MDVEGKAAKVTRPRGRPSNKKITPVVSSLETEPVPQNFEQNEELLNEEPVLEETAVQSEDEASVLFDTPLLQVENLNPFSQLFSFIIGRNRSEILRIAKEIGVSDNTIYRWLNGKVLPRQSSLQRLLEVLPAFRSNPAPLDRAVRHTGRRGDNFAERWEVPREIYHRVLEQAAVTTEDSSRRWHIIGTVFHYALLHLDPERQGMALTYARLMPPSADGTIHSLYEAEMSGQDPWPFTLDFKAYLGSTTLAGASAMLQRVQIWSVKDDDKRTPVGLDPNERSSCAAPIMRAGRIAGVLVVSSTLEDFVRQPGVPNAVSDYANLLAAGLPDSDFYSVSLVNLFPMPELDWQREKIAKSYLNRVVAYSRKQCLSFPEAEQKVLESLEDEFERYACMQEDQLDDSQKPMTVEVERQLR